MDLTMKIPPIILVLFLTFIRLDKVSGVSSCVGCTPLLPGSYKIPYYPTCMSANSSIISQLASSCNNVQFAPDVYQPATIGCQTVFALGADLMTYEKVLRGCVVMDGFVPYGLDPAIARTPAGMCFSHPMIMGGSLTCVCASRDDCNVYPYVGKDSSGKFVPTALQPDSSGNIVPGSSAADITDPVRNPPKSPTNLNSNSNSNSNSISVTNSNSNTNSNTNTNTNTNVNTANGDGSDKSGTADDQSKATASGTNANGSQDPISGAMKNYAKIVYLVLPFLFVFCLDFGFVMF